jgi:hypothetical protein
MVPKSKILAKKEKNHETHNEEKLQENHVHEINGNLSYMEESVYTEKNGSIVSSPNRSPQKSPNKSPSKSPKKLASPEKSSIYYNKLNHIEKDNQKEKNPIIEENKEEYKKPEETYKEHQEEENKNLNQFKSIEYMDIIKSNYIEEDKPVIDENHIEEKSFEKEVNKSIEKEESKPKLEEIVVTNNNIENNHQKNQNFSHIDKNANNHHDMKQNDIEDQLNQAMIEIKEDDEIRSIKSESKNNVKRPLSTEDLIKFKHENRENKNDKFDNLPPILLAVAGGILVSYFIYKRLSK